MSFGEKILNTCTQIVKIVNIPNLPSNPSFTCRPTSTFFFRKLMFWVVDPKIIVILDPIFVNFKKHMLMWKIISFSCTLCWLGFLYPICPSLSSKSVSTSEKLRKKRNKQTNKMKNYLLPNTLPEQKSKQNKNFIHFLHLPWTLNLQTKA